MKLRMTRLLLVEMIAAVAALVIVAAGALAWRLSSGPVSLPFLVDQVEAVLNGLDDDTHVNVEDVVVRWAQEDKAVRLRIVGVEFQDSLNESAARVPELEMDLSFWALIRGRIAPARITLIGGSGLIVRDREGHFRLGLAAAPGAQPTDRIALPKSGPLPSRVPAAVPMPAEDPTPEIKPEIGPETEPEAEPDFVSAPQPPSDDELAAAEARSKRNAALFNRIILKMMEPLDPLDPIGAIEELTITDSRIAYYNQRSKAYWRSSDADLKLSRSLAGVVGKLKAGVDTGGGKIVTLDFHGEFRRNSERVSAYGRVESINPSTVAEQVEALWLLKGFDLPVDGEVNLDFGLDGSVKTASLNVKASAGVLDIAEVSDQPIPVESALFDAVYDGESGQLTINRFDIAAEGNAIQLRGLANLEFDPETAIELTRASLELEAKKIAVNLPKYFDQSTAIDDVTLKGVWDVFDRTIDVERLHMKTGPTDLSVNGKIQFGSQSPEVKLDGRINDFAVDDLDGFWPKGAFVTARSWVTEQVSHGRLTDGRLTVRAEPGDLALEPVPNEVLRFDFHVVNSQAIVVQGLPPLQDIDADMVLEGNRFSLKLNEGWVKKGVNNPIRFEAGSTVIIPDLGRTGSPVNIEARARGNLSDGLLLIDHPPLNFTSALGIHPEKVEADTVIDMSFVVPLEAIVPIDAIQFDARARLSDVAFQDVVGDVDVTGGELTLDIGLEKLKGYGTIELEGGVPAKLNWTETFYPERQGPSSYHVATDLTPRILTGVGFNPAGILDGRVPAKLIGYGQGFDITTFSLSGDLTPATVNLESLGYRKKAGTKGEGSFKFRARDDGRIEVSDIKMTAKDASIQGRFSIAGDGRLLLADFSPFKVGADTDVALKATRTKRDDLDVKLRGRSFNAGPVLEAMLQGGAGADDGAPKSKKKADPSKRGWFVDADLERLVLRDGVTAKDVSLRIGSTKGKLDRMALKGVLGEDQLQATFKTALGGARRIEVTASDAGLLLQGITGIDEVSGGKLDFVVHLDGNPGRQANKGPVDLTPDGLAQDDVRPGPVESHPSPATAANPKFVDAKVGRLIVTDLTLRDAPVLAQLLTIGSLRGMSDTLQGEGIWFKKLDLPFIIDENKHVLLVDDARMAGPALGLTARGTVQLTDNVVDLNGTIVPAYSINSFLGNIPVLGELLVSKEGEGVFGFTYGVSGPSDNLKLFVNPLSGLAPGILRRIFEVGSGPRPADDTAQAETAGPDGIAPQ